MMRRNALGMVLVWVCACAPAKPTITLHGAAESGDLKQLEAHFYHGAPVDQLDADGHTPLGLACREGRVGAVQRLLSQNAKPELADGHGRTPLQHAAGADHRSLVELLLARGVPPGSALHAAIRGGHRQLVGLLVERSADPNEPDASGITPLAAASDADMRALLIELGAQETPLELARRMLRHLDVIFGLLMENPKDCQASAAEVSRYVEQHRNEISGIVGRIQQAEKAMSDADRARFEETVKAEAEGVLKKAMGPMMEFARNCPEQMQALGEAMRTFAP